MEAATKVNWNDDRIDRFAEQVDRRFERVDERFDRLEEHVDLRFKQVDERFDKIESHVEARFNRLEDRFDLLQNSLIIALAGILAAFAALFAAANF
jgi:predicted nuclease with TOPRIM domain